MCTATEVLCPCSTEGDFSRVCLKPRSRRNQIGPEEAARPLSLAKHCNSKARHQGNRSCYRDRSRHVAAPLRQHPSTAPSWGQGHRGSAGLGAAWPVPRGCPGTRGCGDGEGEEWKWPSSPFALLVGAGAALCPMPGLADAHWSWEVGRDEVNPFPSRQKG